MPLDIWNPRGRLTWDLVLYSGFCARDRAVYDSVGMLERGSALHRLIYGILTLAIGGVLIGLLGPASAKADDAVVNEIFTLQFCDSGEGINETFHLLVVAWEGQNRGAVVRKDGPLPYDPNACSDPAMPYLLEFKWIPTRVGTYEVEVCSGVTGIGIVRCDKFSPVLVAAAGGASPSRQVPDGGSPNQSAENPAFLTPPKLRKVTQRGAMVSYYIEPPVVVGGYVDRYIVWIDEKGWQPCIIDTPRNASSPVVCKQKAGKRLRGKTWAFTVRAYAVGESSGGFASEEGAPKAKRIR